MLDIKVQSQLAQATADMMRACALATARAAGASALQGMSLWSQMLRSAERPARSMGTAPSDSSVADASAPQPTTSSPSATEQAFASYRSSGGHAVAQVVLPSFEETSNSATSA